LPKVKPFGVEVTQTLIRRKTIPSEKKANLVFKKQSLFAKKRLKTKKTLPKKVSFVNYDLNKKPVYPS